MEFRESISISVANMKATKVRSGLSVLGLVIGTAAIIIVVAITNGSRKAVIESLSAGSVDVLYIWPSFSETAQRVGRLSLSDVERFAKLPGAVSAAPELLMTKEIRGPGGSGRLKALGVDPGYLEAYRYKLVAGRDITPMDLTGRSAVCLLTREAAKKLFGPQVPVGGTIRVEGGIFEVIGIVERPKETQMSFGMAKYAELFIPLSTVLVLERDINIPSIRLRVAKGKTEAVVAAIKSVFDSDPSRKGLIKVSDPKEYIENIRKRDRALMIQLVSIAGVSLLVGGIGIMNIMLTSVAERTREIGLRKALGATSADVLEQFLVESSFLSGVGGILGSVTGLLVSWILPIVFPEKIPTAPAMWSVVVSVGFSFAFGIFFGLFPASKAAQLSPIEALRYE